jgi:TonB-dependent starch-binding outer membrane protein SusC
VITPDDRTAYAVIGPRYYGGFQNTISFKGFQLDFLFQFVKQDGYNYMTSLAQVPGRRSNMPAWIMERWQKPGDITSVQRFAQSASSPAYGAYMNGRFYSVNSISDASFIRLKNMSLAWQLPMLRIKANDISAKVYAQAQNALTFTKYKGLDPEVQSQLVLPPLKVFTIGLQLTL